ncbi:DUF7882 family protein [Lysinibacter cavernae]|uniref:DUF7882 domain-containing protein n=1 Tax=Lysinibacter cavernae TaxID=1640652 RepID=A0A7X5TU86_9MICO|nr:hypothetical protein [Lysinibacter cavernae]NIH55000.1 hypothetical protein [Lysinibacter cavernae]
MGYLIYGSSTEYEIEDRALAHLKVVIAAKLRRQECFFLNWTNEPDAGSGRVSLWLAPNIPLQFRFAGSRAPELNRLWIEVLADASNTPSGLQLFPESDIEARIKAAEARRESMLADDNS